MNPGLAKQLVRDRRDCSSDFSEDYQRNPGGWNFSFTGSQVPYSEYSGLFSRYEIINHTFKLLL